MNAEEGIMPLGRSTMTPFSKLLLHQALFEAMGPLYGCRNMRFGMCESEGKKWACFLGIVSFCSEVPEEKAWQGETGVAMCAPCICCPKMTGGFRACDVGRIALCRTKEEPRSKR